MISTKIGDLFLKNPTILASGILGVTKSSLLNVAKNGASAVTIKSISKVARKGHNPPIIITYEAGMLNAVGYSNPGYKEAILEYANLDRIKQQQCRVIASVVGADKHEFAYLAKNFVNILDFDALELPLSCPHTPGYGTLAGHGTPKATYEITRAVRKVTDLPIYVKLSPNMPGIGEIAKAAEKAGADAITAINTVGPGMVINLEMQRPVLDFKFGGLSGTAIRPIAVRCVYDIFQAVDIPIIGVGGVSNGRDAIEMIMAGASAVGMGTAVWERGIDVFSRVNKEIEDWMIENNVKSIKEIIGAAHG